MKKNTNDALVMKAIALCYKPFLRPEEALVYCDLGYAALANKLKEYGICKSATGYYRKEDLDRMMAGENSVKEAAEKITWSLRGMKQRQAGGKQ